MSERKTIQFNPDFLKLSGGKTRKKKEKTDNNGEIKIRNVKPKTQLDTLKKRSILRMIRQHQEEKHKKTFDEREIKKDAKIEVSNNMDFESDFEQSKKYMSDLVENKQKSLNSTIKQYPSQTSSLLFNPSINPMKFDDVSNKLSVVSTNPVHIKPRQEIPKYGCMKHGQLPTYRNWLNKTYKNQPTNVQSMNQTHSTSSSGKDAFITVGSSPSTNNIITEIPFVPQQLPSQNLLNASELTQRMAKMQTGLANNKIHKRQRQRRTVKRTYTAGKSKVFPRVSVLVSNKTLRNNISTKAQLLKQISMPEIKKYLIQRGLIRVGSIAPNDVLRKMYESTVLMCGEIQNHNSDNLLYNFLNNEEK